MRKITLMIPHALPSSGKTTYYKKLVETSAIQNKEISRVDVDFWSRKKDEDKEELKKYIKDNIKEKSKIIIIDGLFLDNDIIAFLIRFVVSLFEKKLFVKKLLSHILQNLMEKDFFIANPGVKVELMEIVGMKSFTKLKQNLQ